MEIYRTFVGIPLKVGGSFLGDRAEIMGKLKEDRITWVDPERYHVTLRFLGDTAVTKSEEIGEVLASSLELPVRTDLRFSGPGIFGPRKKPRVIWVGFKGGELFRDLHQNVNHLLAGLGIPEPDQPYRPHLTLGRIRNTQNPDRLYAVIREMEAKFREVVCAEKLVYYRSIPGSGGPVYQPLKSIEFSD